MASTRSNRWHRLYPSLWWLTVALLLLMAAYVVVGRQLMLLVPDYRERLEVLFEERIQTPLTIAELDGKMSGLVPQFVARQIRLPAPEGDTALELDEVVLGIDVFRSLLHRAHRQKWWRYCVRRFVRQRKIPSTSTNCPVQVMKSVLPILRK